MLAMSDLVRPCNALWFVSSDARATLIVVSVLLTLIPFGSLCVNSPFGPLTLTDCSSTVTVTPEGIGTGSFPIRDMDAPPLPDAGDELAAGARLPRLTVGHQALVGAQNREAQAVADARNLRDADVLAKAGRRDALQLANHRLA